MADGQRKRSGPPAGTEPPSTPARPALRRQFLLPANDNALAPLQRILRAVAFIAIGALLAWLLRTVLG